MRVLVACEYSGRVREAFRARGHQAISCDLEPSEDHSPEHITGDVTRLLRRSTWDLVVAFPPCTDLAAVNASHWEEKRRDGRQKRAIEFFMAMYNAPAERVAVENPVGVMSTVFRKPDQYIEPFWFGEPWCKKTGLWLRNLPKLVPTNMVESVGKWVAGQRGKKVNGRRSYSTKPAIELYGKRSAKERARTFQGIADAMAEQWGSL